jgi:hypothetical protein
MHASDSEKLSQNGIKIEVIYRMICSKYRMEIRNKTNSQACCKSANRLKKYKNQAGNAISNVCVKN